MVFFGRAEGSLSASLERKWLLFTLVAIFRSLDGTDAFGVRCVVLLLVLLEVMLVFEGRIVGWVILGELAFLTQLLENNGEYIRDIVLVLRVLGFRVGKI